MTDRYDPTTIDPDFWTKLAAVRVTVNTLPEHDERAPDTQVAPSPPPPDTTFIAGATVETDFAEALRAVREDKRDCFLAWQTADGVRVCSLGCAAFLLEVADCAMDSAERAA